MIFAHDTDPHILSRNYVDHGFIGLTGAILAPDLPMLRLQCDRLIGLEQDLVAHGDRSTHPLSQGSRRF